MHVNFVTLKHIDRSQVLKLGCRCFLTSRLWPPAFHVIADRCLVRTNMKSWNPSAEGRLDPSSRRCLLPGKDAATGLDMPRCLNSTCLWMSSHTPCSCKQNLRCFQSEDKKAGAAFPVISLLLDVCEGLLLANVSI